jgi:hypothetical protein
VDLHIDNRYVPSWLESSDGITLIKYLEPYIQGKIPSSTAGEIASALSNHLERQRLISTIYIEYSNLASITATVAEKKCHILY